MTRMMWLTTINIVWDHTETCRKHIRALKRIANKVKNDEYDYYEKGYFDINTHFLLCRN